MARTFDIFFNNLEKSNKAIRQFSQRNLLAAGIDITFDQWLVLRAINENRGMNQKEIAAMVFKDAASLTRIAELLIKSAYLERRVHDDKRRSRLKITQTGKEALKQAELVINSSLEQALSGIEERRIRKLRKVLVKIANNCN